MKSLMKIVPLAALLGTVAIRSSLAQGTETDELMQLDFQLNAISQGPTTSTRNTVATTVVMHTITSREVIQVLGAAMGVSFSPGAGLYLLAPTNNLDAWTIQVRDGAAKVDVTPFFGHQPGANSVAGTSLNTRTGAGAGTDYSIDGFSLQDAPGFPALSEHFSVSGLTFTASVGAVRRGQVVAETVHVHARVSGAGDRQGSLTMVEGSIDAQGNSTETISSGLPPLN